MNPIEKYPHITESYACILKILAIIFLLPINFLISFEICSTPKELKYDAVLLFTYNATQ